MKRQLFSAAPPLRSLYWSALCGALCVLSLGGCDFNRPNEDTVIENLGFAKPFALLDLDGNRRTMDEFVDKTAFILCFFDSTSEPSMKLIEQMERIYKENEGKSLAVAAIAADSDIPALRRFAQDRKITFPVLTGAEEDILEVAEAYGGARFLPVAFIMNEGHILKRFVGYHGKTEIENVLPALEPIAEGG